MGFHSIYKIRCSTESGLTRGVAGGRSMRGWFWILAFSRLVLQKREKGVCRSILWLAVRSEWGRRTRGGCSGRDHIDG